MTVIQVKNLKAALSSGYLNPMATGELISCELLCYVINKYGNSPNDTLKSVLLAFYSPNEIMAAKEVLYKDSSAMNVDGLPRLVQRRKNEDKARHDVDDIFTLLDALDDRALLGTLPKYVAGDLSRVPPFNSGDLDMSLLLLRVATLESKMSHMVTECVEAAQATLLSQVPNVGACHVALANDRQTPREEDTSMAAADAVLVTPAGGSSWAEVAVTNSSQAPWAIVSHQKQKKPAEKSAPVMRRGTKRVDSESKVKTVSGRLTAFVSRMAKETTSDDLCDFLKQVGMKDVECIKLTPKDGKVFRSAAFRVSCSDESRDLFYDENVWPDGCLLRDWYFKGRVAVRADDLNNPSHGGS